MDYVRDEVSDPSTLPTGQTLADGALKFSAAMMNRAIEQAVMSLETTLSIGTPGASLRVAEMTYTEDSEDSCALPAALADVGGVYKVEDISVSGFPQMMRFVSAQDVERYMTQQTVGLGPLVYCFIAAAPSGTSGHPSWKIQVRPRRSTSPTLRIYYLATPIIPGADADSVGVAARWLQLVSLETAFILLSRQDEFTPQQHMRRMECMEQFRLLGGAYTGDHHVRRTRR